MGSDSGLFIFLGLLFFIVYSLTRGKKKIEPVSIQKKSEPPSVKKKVPHRISAPKAIVPKEPALPQASKQSILKSGWKKPSSLKQAVILSEILRRPD